jgi:hypothetical protein
MSSCVTKVELLLSFEVRIELDSTCRVTSYCSGPPPNEHLFFQCEGSPYASVFSGERIYVRGKTSISDLHIATAREWGWYSSCRFEWISVHSVRGNPVCDTPSVEFELPLLNDTEVDDIRMIMPLSSTRIRPGN